MKPQQILLLKCICLGIILSFQAKAERFTPPKGFKPPASTPKFTENKGQWESPIHFRLDLHQGEVCFEKSSILFNLHQSPLEDEKTTNGGHHHTLQNSFKGHAYRINLLGSNSVIPQGENLHEGCTNFLLGNDKSKWKSNVLSYSQIYYPNVYEHITLKFEGKGDDLKYEYIVAPNGNTDDIVMDYEGVESIKLKNESLIIALSIGTVKELKPYSYQVINGKKVEVASKFVLKNNSVSFEFPNGYDKTKELIIDPTLNFATMTGSTADNFGFTATYDVQGNFYGGGIVLSSFTYPTSTGAFQSTYGGNVDIAITKFNPTGTAIVYSTLLGGSECEQPSSLVVNSLGQLVILGTTSSSTDYPLTNGAYSSTFGGGTAINFAGNGTNFANGSDIILTILNANGTALIGSTFFGGSGNDGLNNVNPLQYNYGDQFRGEVVVDAQNNVYIASTTQSSDFPVTAGVSQSALSGPQDGIVAKFNPTLTSLIWGTYLGGNSGDAAYSLFLDANNSPYVSGGTTSSNFPTTAGALHNTALGGIADGWIAHLNPNGTAILAATYIGTSAYDQAYFVASDVSGNVYTVGQTTGNYPTTAGAFSNANGQQFIHKLNPSLSTTIAAAKFGTGASQINISPTAFLVDICERVYVAGWGGDDNGGSTLAGGNTTGLPTTANAIQSTTDGSDFYFFVLENNFATQLYGSFYGGFGSIEHVDGGTSRFDPRGVMYEAVCASCGSTNGFPTTPGVYGPLNNGSDSFGNVRCNYGGIKISFEITDVNVGLAASPNATGCAPFTVNFTSSSNGADLYQWDFNDGGATSIAAAPSHTFQNPGTYQVRIIGTDTNACPGVTIADTAFLTIIVSSGTVLAGADQTTCAGSCITLNATGATTYTWTPVTGLSNPTSATPTACPAVTTTYIVTGTSNSCTDTDTVTVFVTTPPNVSASNDTTICVGGTAQLNATGGLSYSWSPATGLSNASIANPTASPSTTTTYIVSVTAPSGNLVQNGDFSGGNTGFTSSYVNNANLVPEGRYEVTADANNTHPNFFGVDHTSGNGLFMAVNGSGVANTDVWCQTMAVTPNTLYAFSTYVSTLSPSGNVAILQFSINGVPLATPFNAPANINNWIQFFQSWNSGNATTATICIVNQNTATGGNDFGLDDITFAPTCTTTDTVIVTVAGNLINAGQDQQICPGDTVQLNATNGQTYSWTPTITLSNPNIANPLAFPSQTTDYVVNGIDTLGCNSSDTVTITVNPLPNVDAGQNQNICLGDSTQLNATGALTYSWSPATGLSNTAIPNPFAQPVITTTYTVTGTSQAGCVNVDSMVLTINPPPIAVVSGPVSICPGGSTQLNASGGLAYSWSPATGLNNPNTANPIASPLVTTTYDVAVFDVSGCSDTASVTVTVLPAPTINAGPNTGYCAGGSVQLNATGGQSYSWTPANGLSNPNIANPVASPNFTTTYIVTGTAQNTCTNTDTITVEVWPNPNANAGQDQTICSGSFVQLLGSGGQTYQWNPGATLSNDTIFNPTGTPATTTTYTLTVGNQFGCTDQDQVLITIVPAPAYTLSNDTIICPGTSAQLNATAVGSTGFTWQPITGLNNPFIANPISTPPFTIFYTLNIQTATCSINDSVTVVVAQPDFANAGTDQTYCNGGTANLTASGGVSYQWFPSIFLTNTNTANTTTSSDTSIIYGVIVTSPIGCLDTDYVDIVVNPLPNVDAGPIQDAICINSTLQLTATGADHYVWHPGISLNDSTIANPTVGPIATNQVYTVVGIDTAFGCQNIDSILVILTPLPLADAGNDTLICPGNTVTLNASGGASYFWSPPDGLSNVFIANPIAYPSVSTEYIVFVSDTNQCTNTDTVLISVFSLNFGGDTAICQGDTVQISLPVGGSYLWNPSTGVSDTTSSSPFLFPDKTTSYLISATDSAAGCLTEGSFNVEVLPGAVAKFVAKYMPGCDSLVVKTFNNSLYADSYLWNWGWDDSSKAYNPMFFLPYGNGRMITLIAVSNNGCNDTLTIDSSSVVFDDSLISTVPNVFSPNGDGQNDCFRPEVEGWFADCYRINVYNRWGELIFESLREGHCWDGRTKGGNPAESGTYFYVAKVRDMAFKGYVQLLR